MLQDGHLIRCRIGDPISCNFLCSMQISQPDALAGALMACIVGAGRASGADGAVGASEAGWAGRAGGADGTSGAGGAGAATWCCA
jgi:hypothetical protein